MGGQTAATHVFFSSSGLFLSVPAALDGRRVTGTQEREEEIIPGHHVLFLSTTKEKSVAGVDLFLSLPFPTAHTGGGKEEETPTKTSSSGQQPSHSGCWGRDAIGGVNTRHRYHFPLPSCF